MQGVLFTSKADSAAIQNYLVNFKDESHQCGMLCVTNVTGSCHQCYMLYDSNGIRTKPL